MHHLESACHGSLVSPGFAFLEVLLALVIICSGLLGILTMQMATLHHSREAYLQSVATVQVSNFMERLRVNESAAARNQELDAWNQCNAQLLPKGEGSFQCIAKNCSVQLHWVLEKAQSLTLTASL